MPALPSIANSTRIDHHKVGGVTSNYRHDLAPYIWQLVQNLKPPSFPQWLLKGREWLARPQPAGTEKQS